MNTYNDYLNNHVYPRHFFNKNENNHPYYINQYPEKHINNLYDPYEGFIHGTMFKDLYDPYKTNKPFKIEPMNEQAEMLTKYDALCFAKIDLNLYLDINPEDKEALDLFNKYRTEAENLKNMYESKYGPLTTDSDFLNTWSWKDSPWPWQN